MSGTTSTKDNTAKDEKPSETKLKALPSYKLSNKQKENELSITPQQALEAAKVLWPDTTHVAVEEGMTAIHFNESLSIAAKIAAKIDWPEGVTLWPKPEPKYRDARMPEDWGKSARFRDSADKEDEWESGVLSGMCKDALLPWVDEMANAYEFCQVIDEPPVTFADVVAALSKPAIDPGEGWRLLSKDEPTIEGDEYYYNGVWEKAHNWSSNSGKQTQSCPYRRKVEAEPIKVGDKVKIAKKVETLYWRPAMDSTVGCEGNVSEVSLHPLKHQAFVTLDTRDGWWYPLESLEKVLA